MPKIAFALAALMILTACDSMDGVFRDAPFDAPVVHPLNDLPIQMRDLV